MLREEPSHKSRARGSAWTSRYWALRMIARQPLATCNCLIIAVVNFVFRSELISHNAQALSVTSLCSPGNEAKIIAWLGNN